ncbi:hypothetical protein [Algibacter sp. 2305UL17-15]|uniref:hypothetical protein n=1 Tax=Algibacter sp. 2305UL17-15 TaxID=3231268 RepID=UPI0034583315
MTIKPFIIPIICFLIGMALTSIGALFKIIHFEIGSLTGNVLLSLATGFKLLAIILAIIKLLVIYKEK